MNSTALQNPSDPEATFRTKAGKEYRGYVASLEEAVGKNGSIVTDYAYEQNIHSDSQFLKEHLKQMEVQEKSITVVADSAYSGTENTALAKEKNVNLTTTSLTRREAPDIIADFEQAARIITAADCLRNMSYGLLQKIDMGKVIEIDDGSQLICQLKFFRRRIIRGKHDLLPFEFHSLCHHKLCK